MTATDDYKNGRLFELFVELLDSSLERAAAGLWKDVFNRRRMAIIPSEVGVSLPLISRAEQIDAKYVDPLQLMSRHLRTVLNGEAPREIALSELQLTFYLDSARNVAKEIGRWISKSIKDAASVDRALAKRLKEIALNSLDDPNGDGPWELDFELRPDGD